MHERGAIGEGGLRVQHGRERIVVDVDELRRVLGEGA